MKSYEEFISGLQEDIEVPEKVWARFEMTLDNLPDKRKKKHFRWPVPVAAAVAAALTLSFGVYAAVRLIGHTVMENEEKHGAEIRFENEDKVELPLIEITPGYLPEGYKECEKGCYSPNGEYGVQGLTIVQRIQWDSLFFSGYTDFEELQMGSAKVLYSYTEGKDAAYDVVMIYEDGQVIEVYGCKDLSKDEVLKVCENLSYTEMSEPDMAEERTTFAEREDNSDVLAHLDAWAKVQSSHIVEKGEMAVDVLSGLKENSDDIKMAVTKIEITDDVNVSLMNRNTVYDYENVMNYIQNGKLRPFERIVSETGDTYEIKQRTLDTVSVKNVMVTLKMTNSGSTDYDDVPVYPSWKNLYQIDENYYGIYQNYLGEGIPGYEADEHFAGVNQYGIDPDNRAYYFDSSAYPGSTHFNFTSIKAGETKEMQLWFAIPEDQLDDAYLVFNTSAAESQQAVKICE